MKYTHEVKGNTLHLVFSGDLIGENKGPELVELTKNLLSDGVIFCVADISDVRYINSSGIGVLITILTKFRNKGGELYIVNPSEHVKKLLIITKLLAIFNVVSTIEDALEKITAVK